MANYEAVGRTSYTKVADTEAFLAWFGELHGVRLIKKRDATHGTLYGFVFVDDVSVYRINPEDEDEPIEVDIVAELQPHIAEGWGISIVEIGMEASRYLVGQAIVVTRESITSTCLDDFIKAESERLGAIVGLAEY